MRLSPPRTGSCVMVVLTSGLLLAGGLAATAGGMESPDKRAEKFEMLIEPQSLDAQRAQGKVRILDARSANEYRSGHIPGAVHVDVAAWTRLALSEGGLEDKRAWSEKVRSLGIRQGTAVVVYGERLPEVARIWWTLKYLGVEQVAILDGGWTAWKAERLAVSRESTEVDAATFEPRFQLDRLAGIETVKESLGRADVAIVDARTRDEFTGREVRGERGGRIPGAKHLDWVDLIDADGRVKPREELQRLFAHHGILPEQTAITC
jgi:thiosulfate/3-mercaptopyruvate sulfurtransferase